MEARFSPATFGRFLLDVLLRKTKKGENEKMRIDTGKRMGGVSGLRAAYLAGDGGITAADGADPGELFRRPGGTIYLGFEGEKTAGTWGFIWTYLRQQIPHGSLGFGNESEKKSREKIPDGG